MSTWKRLFSLQKPTVLKLASILVPLSVSSSRITQNVICSVCFVPINRIDPVRTEKELYRGDMQPSMLHTSKTYCDRSLSQDKTQTVRDTMPSCAFLFPYSSMQRFSTVILKFNFALTTLMKHSQSLHGGELTRMLACFNEAGGASAASS